MEKEPKIILKEFNALENCNNRNQVMFNRRKYESYVQSRTNNTLFCSRLGALWLEMTELQRNPQVQAMYQCQ